VIWFVLTDAADNPQFQSQWFYAAQPGKTEMLAVALAAIANQNQVHVWLDPPPNGLCHDIYVIPS